MSKKISKKSYIIYHYFSNLYHGNLFFNLKRKNSNATQHIKSIITKPNNKYANIQNTTLKIKLIFIIIHLNIYFKFIFENKVNIIYI